MINNSYFGEIEMIFNTDRICETITECTSHLFYLNRDHFLSIKDKFIFEWLEL